MAPLQQSSVTSQREGVAPLQQSLVPPQRLRPVSHQDVPLLVSSRWDAPSMNQARGRSRSRSRPPAPISRDPRPWNSLFKAPVGSPDLRLGFFPLEVQADQKITMYETVDSNELIETWSMAIVVYSLSQYGFLSIDFRSTLGQPLYIDKATASQTRLTFARVCVMVSSDEELPNEVFYRDLDGSTRKPSQKITQVYRPRQEPQHGFATTIPSTDTLVPTVTVAEKMNKHSDSLGQ
ncbi:hypothetical protein BHE74_00025585 [Ensete ventricosum]|nr:hypothetical protein BHE74_00025585 [Ensete ventricosum]